MFNHVKFTFHSNDAKHIEMFGEITQSIPSDQQSHSEFRDDVHT